MSLREQHNQYMKKINKLKSLGYNVFVQHEDWRRNSPFVDAEGKWHKPKYMTFCCIDKDMAEGSVIVEYAFCCPKDTPNRKLGWSIAVGRALKRWEEFNGKLEV